MSPAAHALLLLAAGGSRRLGEPKQLLRLDGESLVRRAARLGLATAPAQAIVVTGASGDAVWAELADLPMQRVHNAAWPEGMGASLARGLAAVHPRVAGALVLLCDQPALAAGHLLALRDRWRADPAGAAASAYDGVLGVPALLPRAWFPALAGAGGDRGARDLLRRHADRVAAVPLHGLARDIDTLAQAQGLARPPRLGDDAGQA